MRKNNNSFIFLVLFIAFVLSVVRLGSVPLGVSPEEARFGILLTNILGIKVTDVFLIRLPFAFLGVFGIYLFYKYLGRTNNNNFSLLGAILLTVTPWYIQESRIFSWGMLIFVLILIVLLRYSALLSKNASKIIIYIVVTASLFFVLSVFKIPPTAKNDVDYQRNIASSKLPIVVTKFFSNKLVESYRFREKIFFEHLDFGNYFFSGYPRPRWGIEEYQKLFFVFLPFLIYGILKTKKETLLVTGGLYFAYALMLSAFSLREGTWSLPFLLILVPFVAKGLLEFSKIVNFKFWSLLFIGLFVFEFFYFVSIYALGVSESQFSKHSTIYKELTQSVLAVSKNYDKIYITTRLDNPDIYFDFYAPEIKSKFIYKDLDLINDSAPDALFVGILPFEPSPSETLYKTNGNWPEYINVFKDIKDTKHRFDVVIFSSHL